MKNKERNEKLSHKKSNEQYNSVQLSGKNPNNKGTRK